MFLRKLILLKAVRKGFTLIELTMSIAIMGIILGISMSGGPQTLMRVSLADNAHKIELSMRETQLQGSTINSLNNTFGGAGLYFSRATSTRVIKFKDRAIPDETRAINIGNGLYDITPTNEKVEEYNITNGHRIGKLCVATTSPSVFYCNAENDPTIPSINNLTVSFSRPKQIAHIYINNSTTTDYAAACIQFDSTRSPAKGFVRSVLIYKSGLISRKVDTCN